MDSSAAIRTGDHSSDSHGIKNEPSRCKTIGFAIVIILGLGGLAVAGVGLGGYLQAGSLSSLGQVNSIIMMAAGGGGGIVFLIIRIVGSVKNCQKGSHAIEIEGGRSTIGSERTIEDAGSGRPIRAVPSSIDTEGGRFFGPEAYSIWGAEVVGTVEDIPEHLQVTPREKDSLAIEGGRSTIGSERTIEDAGSGRPIRAVPSSIDTEGGRFFGPEAYSIWGAEVVGTVEDIPEHLQVTPGEIDPFFGRPVKENFALIYFPGKVRLKDGREVDVTLKTLEQISGKPFYYFTEDVEWLFGDTPLQPGWRRMSRGVIPDSGGKAYEAQKAMVEGKKGHRLPDALEVAVFIQLVKAITGEKLYSAGTYTRCNQKVRDHTPVIVGDFDRGVIVSSDHVDYSGYGACAVRE